MTLSKQMFSRVLLFASLLVTMSLVDATVPARGQAPPPPNPSPFGPNVYVITPAMSSSAINNLLNALNQEAQFSTNRYAVLFQPGNYGTASNPVGAQVGYYEQISGLGDLPTGVTINGGMAVDQLVGTAPTADMTQNFWRSLENFSQTAVSGASGILDWGVSQGTSLRRMNIQSNLWYANSMPINGENACQQSSGGFMSDSNVSGKVNACSQQQWYTRNSNLPAGFSGNVWNFVFSGVTGAPNPSYPGGAAGDTNMTVLSTTPVSKEKPFLHFAGGNYSVFVPGVQYNSSGPSWSPNLQSRGADVPIGSFFIATPASSIQDINNALAGSSNLILTPGIYKYDAPIHVVRGDTIVLGMGFATIVPQTGSPAMVVDDVDGVQVAGILIDAGPVTSATLLEVGAPGFVNYDHDLDPASLHDVFFRIGGGTAGSTDTALQVDSGSVILDNIWAWRADHGNAGTVGWNVNIANHGLVVNGVHVEAQGLFVEHFQKEQTLWNGNGGQTIFYQSELPYDVPNPGAWSNGTQNGYPSYQVSWSAGCNHKAYGMGIYSFFNQGVNIVEDNAVLAPNTLGTSIKNVGTVFLNGSGQIGNVIDGIGGTATSATSGKLIPVNSFQGTAPCDNSQLELPPGSTVPLLRSSFNPSFYNPNNYDSALIMNALRANPSDLTIIAAHRGLHALAIPNQTQAQIQAPNIPENSLESIERAASDGWEAAEIDIQSTSDNVPILSHDKTWGREWCSYNPSLSYYPTDRTPFDPINVSDANTAKNPLVTVTSLYRTRYYARDNATLRDYLHLVKDDRRSPIGGPYLNGCLNTTGIYGTGSAYPPTLTDVLNDMRQKKIHMVLFLDVKTAATATDIWKVLNPSSGNAPVDDQGRPYYQSIVFKMDARNFPGAPYDFDQAFQPNPEKVNFMPLFTSGSLPPPQTNGQSVVDTQDAGFDAPIDAGPTPSYFKDIADMENWLRTMESPTTKANIVSVEVVEKEPNGVMRSLLDFARSNQGNGQRMAVADFNAVGDYYPPADGSGFANGNRDTTVVPKYYRSWDGTCCDYLTHYLYNNPDGDPSGSKRIDLTKPFDGSDQRRDQQFIGTLNLGTVNSDYPSGMDQVLRALNKRNTCYMVTNYSGGACTASSTGGVGPANGTYTLTNLNSNLAMDVTGGSTANSVNIEQWTPTGGVGQQWQLTAQNNGNYLLVSALSGLCFDVSHQAVTAGATLDQYTCNGQANQLFAISQNTDGSFSIVGAQSGLAVEVPGYSTAAGTVLDQAAKTQGSNQKWLLQVPGIAAGTYTITNINSGFLMDVTGGSTANSTNVQQWTPTGGPNQQWQLKPLTGNQIGQYQIVNVKSGLCLDVSGQSVSTGASIDQYTCNGQANQLFTLQSNGDNYLIVGVQSSLAVEVPGSSTTAGAVLDQWTINRGNNQLWIFTKVN